MPSTWPPPDWTWQLGDWAILPFVGGRSGRSYGKLVAIPDTEEMEVLTFKVLFGPKKNQTLTFEKPLAQPCEMYHAFYAHQDKLSPTELLVLAKDLSEEEIEGMETLLEGLARMRHEEPWPG
jgi:hypothetical protein